MKILFILWKKRHGNPTGCQVFSKGQVAVEVEYHRGFLFLTKALKIADLGDTLQGTQRKTMSILLRRQLW